LQQYLAAGKMNIMLKKIFLGHVISLSLCALCLIPTVSEAASAKKLVVEIDEQHTLFVLPFSFSHKSATINGPTIAERDSNSSTSLTYTMKTPEGLRRSDGAAVAHIVKDKNGAHYVLYVLYKGHPSYRVSTMQVTHLPFTVTKGTSTTETYYHPHELRNYAVTNKHVPLVGDIEEST
jgi:hypothetical protein